MPTELQRRRTVLWFFLALLTGACVQPSVGIAPPPVEILPADSGAFRFGTNAADVLTHPKLADNLRLLFGADWSATGTASGGTATPATEFFGKSDALRRVRIAEQEYIAVSGCVARACGTHRGLLLIHGDGEQMRARLDEAGFSHYYGLGAGLVMDPSNRALVDGAWTALEMTK